MSSYKKIKVDTTVIVELQLNAVRVKLLRPKTVTYRCSGLAMFC